MNIFEKTYSLLAILFEIGLVSFFLLRPEYQRLSLLLPASLVGLLINTILIFVIFHDIYPKDLRRPEGKGCLGGSHPPLLAGKYPLPAEIRVSAKVTASPGLTKKASLRP